MSKIMKLSAVLVILSAVLMFMVPSLGTWWWSAAIILGATTILISLGNMPIDLKPLADRFAPAFLRKQIKYR